MKLRIFGYVLLGILSLTLIVAMFGGGTVGFLRIFGTEIESAKTDVYRENKSYVEGTIRDLRQLRVQYEAATDEQKPGLRSLILQRAGELDWDNLPSDVRRFLEEL